MWLDVSMATVYILTAKLEEMSQMFKDRCCPDSAVNEGPEHSQQIDQQTALNIPQRSKPERRTPFTLTHHLNNDAAFSKYN